MNTSFSYCIMIIFLLVHTHFFFFFNLCVLFYFMLNKFISSKTAFSSNVHTQICASFLFYCARVRVFKVRSVSSAKWWI